MNSVEFIDLLRLLPVQRAIIALIVAGSAFPIIGVWIMGLNILPVRFAMMHVALFGIALGLLLGIEPTLVALLVCGASGASLAPLAHRPAGLAGPMGIVMTMAIASALLLLSQTGINANGAFELLWGSILATRQSDLIVLVVVSIGILGVYGWQRRDIALLLYDREIALCSGIAVDRLTMGLLIIIALSIAAAVRLTGALLVDAITILPAIAARNLGQSLGSTIAWAMAIGVVGNLVGFCLTLMFNQPPGPMLVITVGGITILSYLRKEPV